MSIAKGQDLQAEDFWQNTPPSVRLAIPSICYVEALATLQHEKKYNEAFIRSLDINISEAERDENSQTAKLVVNLLRKSKIGLIERLNDIELRFYLAFNKLNNKAEMITLNSEVILGSLNKNILEKHLMDKLILECIVHHARLHSSEIKVFLSANSNEFGKREVTEILRSTGVQYFNKTQNFLGWLQSQSN